MKNIIFFGPPGAGKGTQAKFLIDKLKSYQISTGDILREEIKKETEIGKKIINNMNEGKFVDDHIVNSLLEKISPDENLIMYLCLIQNQVQFQVFLNRHDEDTYLSIYLNIKFFLFATSY